jgi:tetratricopeptide (TPR) repeat protein
VGQQQAASTQHADLEILQLTNQVKRGDLSGLRQYLARTRETSDWNDRSFVLDEVVPSITLPALDFACDTEPGAADLFVIRASYFTNLAWRKRGSGTADKITEDRWAASANCIKEALAARDRAVQLDPQDPTAHVEVLQSLGIFCPLWPEMRATFQRVTALSADIILAHRPIVSILAKRWGGSHEQSLDFARTALAKAPPGSDMAYCLFWAHNLVYTHPIHFDNDPEAADKYLHSQPVTDELNAAFDAWTNPPYLPRRSSIPLLHTSAAWFYRTRDLDRLRKALNLIGGVFDDGPWRSFGDPRAAFDRATLIAAGKLPDEPENFEYLDASFAAIASCLHSVNNNDLPRALASLVVAVQKLQAAPADQQPHLKPLVMLNMSWLNQKMKKEKDAAKLREDALALLDAIPEPLQSARYQFQLGEALERLGEWRRSIPVWEQALAQAGDDTEPQRISEMLRKMGAAYTRIGARDQAAVPLRSALRICHQLPGDPRLPVLLINLGNAVRKAEPAEAEACYREAAQIHEAAMKPLAASAPLANLALLYCDQGRFQEALALQQKVFHIREQNSKAPRSSLASVLNNIANTFRQMRQFKEAHAAIDRAIKHLSAEDTLLSSAYGTRADIYEDAGDDKHAAEWHRKSCDERGRQPSPDLQELANNLEHAIACLTRLGKTKEIPALQQSLTSVRKSIASIPQGEFDENKGKDPAEAAAVLIELRVGLRSGRTGTHGRVAAFARSLWDEASRHNAGRYTGSVASTETTTLTFTGKDSDHLYQVLEPHLAIEEMCAGAKIVIRQGLNHREVHIPVRPEMVN